MLCERDQPSLSKAYNKGQSRKGHQKPFGQPPPFTKEEAKTKTYITKLSH